MRFIIGGIMHETHTFSREITSIDKFDISRGEELLRFAGSNHSVGGALDGCARRGIEAVPAFFAIATPAGLVPAEAFETLLDELAERVASSLPADGIVLTLHGAMVAKGSPDAEAAILERVRDVAGETIPIAVTLDFHANIGQRMVDLSTIITTYDTYPHVDIAERADEAVGLLQQVVLGEIEPATVLIKPPLIPVPQVQQTAIEPFRTILERAHDMETRGEALTVTVAGGFAYADVPDAGVSFLVTTNGDRAAAATLANELAGMLWERQEMLLASNPSVPDAVADAIAAEEWPVILVDVGDNVGGGTPGDATEILAELLRQNAVDATIVIADPESVQQAIAAGVRNEVSLRVGGKVDDLHGDPVELTGRVVTITDGQWVHEGPENAGVPADMGPAAVVRAGGVNVILTSVKSMPGDLNQLRSVGIEPSSQRIIVVKASVRWRGGFEPIMARGILVDTSGLGSVDLSRFAYESVRRPIFPLDERAEWG
ncbi:MAG: M81 family metallopeptidase [Thermomicrobiales bacterium]|nr:M81 family metallopeptidase [Thermomicrobiales bacterium]